MSRNETPSPPPEQPASPARRVGFVLLSPVERPVASTRIAALQVFDGLRQHGFEPEVLYAPATPHQTPDPGLHAADIARRGIRVVVFQKVHGPHVLRLAQELQAVGVATVYLVCDIVEPQMCAACTATVVVTEYLKSLYPKALQPRIHVVHDGIERPEVVATPRPIAPSRSEPLRGVFVTSEDLVDLPGMVVPPPWMQVHCVGEYAPRSEWLARWRRTRWAVRVAISWQQRWNIARALACPRVKRVVWTPEGVYDELQRADVGLIPIDTDSVFRLALQPMPSWTLKSENRLTLMMCAGLPVVATPIPAYEALITPGVDGFLARSRGDWRRAFGALREPARRHEMAAAARARVLMPYSRQRQAEQLADVFAGVLPNAHSRVDE